MKTTICYFSGYRAERHENVIEVFTGRSCNNPFIATTYWKIWLKHFNKKYNLNNKFVGVDFERECRDHALIYQECSKTAAISDKFGELTRLMDEFNDNRKGEIDRVAADLKRKFANYSEIISSL